MAKQAATQQQQIQPGQLFRLPGIGARPRRVEEAGPAAFGASVTLATGTTTGAGFSKFQTLDIDAAFLFETVFTTTYTEGTGTISPSPLFPANNVAQIQVQFESAYSTLRLPGWMAQVFQQFRSAFGPMNRLSALAQSGINTNPANSINPSGANGWFASNANNPLGTTANLAMNVTGTAQTYSMYYEIPVSFYFDLYYELSATGAPIGMPIPRAIVSPQRMAATTRNVIPKVTYAAGFATNDNYDSPASVGTVPGTAAYVGSVVENWWRQAWIPTDDMATEPPGRMWQYTRDYIQFQPNQAGVVPIPLDDEVPGQGQILCLFFGTWDPTLGAVSGQGGFTPYSSYSTVELKYGSSVQIFQDTPGSNQYAWLMQHGSILPQGLMGWDLGLTMDGKFTNENALNTLVQAGCQLVITYNSSSKPAAGSTVYIGLEVLKKVGS
jgi:hypothetical protein